MGSANPIASLFGRILLAGLFLISGLGKFQNWSGTVAGMEAKNVPLPQVALVIATTLELLGAASVLLGIKARWGAVLLLLFLAPVTYFMHNFWDLEGEQRMQEMISFMKNVAIGGGLLMILAMGPGSISLDRFLPRRKSPPPS